jgi:hypothetical protein
MHKGLILDKAASTDRSVFQRVLRCRNDEAPGRNMKQVLF